MGKASLHQKGRDALDQIKTLFTKTKSSQNTKALGDQLKIFSGDNTLQINNDERKLLFDIADEYLNDRDIVYYCMCALKCNIREGLIFMSNSVTTSRICATTNSVSKVHQNDALILNLMASILATLTQHREAVSFLIECEFLANFLNMMENVIALQEPKQTNENRGLMWCSRIFNNICLSGLCENENFKEFKMKALILLIKGMESTSDYFTFEDSVDTIIHICEKTNNKIMFRDHLNQDKFGNFLSIQLEKYLVEEKKNFKKNFYSKLVDLQLVSTNK